MRKSSLLLLILGYASMIMAFPKDGFFDGNIGNPGVININKSIESITADDVLQAYYIKSIPLKPENVYTAAQLGLKKGTSVAIGKANAEVLRHLPNDCKMVHLDDIYNVFLNTNAGGVKRYREKAIMLNHDIIFDGEVDGHAVGGFSTNQLLFYTEHSLELRKLHIEVEKSGQYFTFFINCVNGIDHVKVEDCTFIGKDKNSLGRTFFFHCDDATPLKNGKLIANNHIDHILFSGNEHQGKAFISSSCLRIGKSCRIIGNSIYDVLGVAISMGTENKGWATMMSFTSCPVYIVGNTITGKNQVMKKRDSYAVYHCAALIEKSRLYMLHNNIRNFISGRTLYTKPTGEEVEGSVATYDLYFGGQQVYFVNNHVTNLLQFSKERQFFGTLKAKGHGIPKSYAKKHIPIIRHYTNNIYDIDRNEAMTIWNARRYPTTGSFAKEIAYDKSLDAEDVLTLNLNSYTGKLPVDRLSFSNNRIIYPNIGGMISSSQWICKQFVCENNMFNSNRITSDEYSSRYKSPTYNANNEWLFCIRGESSLISIRNNTFTARNEHIRLMLYKHNNGEAARGKKTIVENNTCGKGASILMRSLNTSTWTYGTYGRP